MLGQVASEQGDPDAAIDHLIDALVQFRQERDWAQFHDNKNLAAAVGIEAGELDELFLWNTIKESEGVDRERLKEELAEVLAYALLLAHKHGIDVRAAVLEKITKSATNYPVEKAWRMAAKYTDL
jgi:NTP pyrophosphatase (non-canonical NTP hydrolase)